MRADLAPKKPQQTTAEPIEIDNGPGCHQQSSSWAGRSNPTDRAVDTRPAETRPAARDRAKMQSASPQSQEEDDIQLLLKNIPACIRCRQNHRRCDPSLPWCRNCVKAGHTECVYFDPIIGEQVERRCVLL